MRKFAFVGCAFLLSLQLATRDADAALTTFFGEDLGTGTNLPLTTHTNADEARALFLAELSNPGTEDFEDFQRDTEAPLSITFPGAMVTATLTGAGKVKFVPGTSHSVGRYAISGEQFWQTGLDVTTLSFGVEFTAPVAAFGFYGVDIGDFGGQVILTLTLDGDVVETINIGNTIGAPDGGVLYFGLIETTLTFDAITFDNTTSGNEPDEKDFFAFDDMTVGSLEQVEPPNPIPEPASLALFGLGLGGVGFMRRRKKAIG